MVPTEDPAQAGGLTRDDLVAAIAKAHKAPSYRESATGGQLLAAQSRLPKVIAENLGAGFGEWTFFPSAEEIVDFACGYAPPATEEALWGLARAWAADDAAGRPTVLALVGLDVVRHELRRIDVPALRPLVDASTPAAVRAARERLGLAVPAAAAQARKGRAAGGAKAAAGDAAPAAGPTSGRAAPPARAPAATPEGARIVRAIEAGVPARMPKPAFVRPKAAPPPPPPRRFHHPKFGEGLLEAENGVGPDAKLTIKFESGSKVLLARAVTEISG